MNIIGQQNSSTGKRQDQGLLIRVGLESRNSGMQKYCPLSILVCTTVHTKKN